MSVQLYGMTCGWLTMDYGFFLKGEKGQLTVPVPGYLVKHPKGMLVFDTGLEKGLQGADEAQHAEVLGPLAPYVGVEYREGEDIATRLAAADVDATKIDAIINSHLHYDHCGGNPLVPNARMIVQQREWHQAHTDDCLASGAYCPAHFDAGHERCLIDGEHDVFGEGSVVVIPSYGHTEGHQSLRVRLDDGDVVITGDACYLRQSLDQMRLPVDMVVHDREAMLDTFRAFRRLQKAGAQLIFGHDPEQWKGLNAGPLRRIHAQSVA